MKKKEVSRRIERGARPGTLRRAVCVAACLWASAGVAWAAGDASTPAAAAVGRPAGSAPVAGGASASGGSAVLGTSRATGASHASGASRATGAVPASGASHASGASPASAASPTSAASTPVVVPLTVPQHPPLTPEQAAQETHEALQLRSAYAHEVTRRLHVPVADQRAYGRLLQRALDEKGLGALAGEYVVLVDRAATVQALFVYFRATTDDPWQMIGASPVATGRPGEFDHFLTPLGVFLHSPANMDFRAEGTMNQNGIRGYGRRDMRIYDFGWVDGERGWGKGGRSPMRFQMHATDPDRLEPLLGIRHSKGCVRIPASLNVFIDHHGILDAEYEARARSGKSLWVLHSDRQVTPWAGRFLVVVDSGRKTRPAWSPAPGSKARAKLPPGGDTAD